ncbi:MAG: ArnT family glycosyltransferase [Aggregatilineaceae bacterium]
MSERREFVLVGVLALIWAAVLALLITQPGYTDAYYYYNAARRLAEGQGLSDPYLWTYFNAPEHLPGPSHTYWMPLESLVVAVSLSALGTTFRAAQVPSVLSYAALITLAYSMGRSLGKSRRHGWIAALLVVFSGFYVPFWVTTDTFALYGLIGALALLSSGRAAQSEGDRWFFVGGMLGALAHLARADGVLLALGVLGASITRREVSGWRGLLKAAGVGLLGYLLVMTPWFVRNLSVLGTPLPLGGTDAIWLRSYDDLVRYPPGSSMADFLAWGIGPILRSRLTAFLNNLGTLVAVETWVVLGPFAVMGIWHLRRDFAIRCFVLYAIVLHLLMTFVFAFPGYRGGLFHSSSALLPFWAVTASVGLEAAIAWAARRRRWRYLEARRIFSAAAVILALALTVSTLRARLAGWNANADSYRRLAGLLSPEAVVMVNDPPALYYHTGLAGVVVPNASPDVLPELAARYGVTHLRLDVDRTAPFSGLFLGQETRPYLQLIYREGEETTDQADDWLLFAIERADDIH